MPDPSDLPREPSPALRRRPLGSGDEWVDLPDGRRFWGSFGAAGLLVRDPGAGVLLQHRAGYSHFGGTWGLPGGARHAGESAVEAALRESGEEASVPPDAVGVVCTSVLDLGVWSYTTVLAEATRPFEPVIGDAESQELRWVPESEVSGLPLHPGLAADWPTVSTLFDLRPTLVVDGANVVGSRPDGWWRDRPGAAARLRSGLARLGRHGVPAVDLSLPAHAWYPRIVLVVEGEARSVEDAADGVELVRAPADGDREIARLADGLPRAVVVTADRELARRVAATGAGILGPRRLWELIDAAE